MNCFLTAVLRAATVRFNPRAAAVLGAGYTFNACKRLIYEKKRTLELYHFLSLYTAGSFYFLLGHSATAPLNCGISVFDNRDVFEYRGIGNRTELCKFSANHAHTAPRARSFSTTVTEK